MNENQEPDLLQQVEQLKAELATATAFHTRQRDNAWLEIEKLENRERLFGELLAVLNGDGGHYTAEHGVEAAIKRGLERHYAVLAEAAGGHDDRLKQQTDWFQQRFNALRTWVNREVRPLSEECAHRYFAIIANGSPAPHEQADWRETMHGLTLRAESAERLLRTAEHQLINTHNIAAMETARANRLSDLLAASEQEVVRLRGLQPELPPRVPDGEGVPRYGLRWNGPEQPVAVPVDDGYWTPFHLVEHLRDYFKIEFQRRKALVDLLVRVFGWSDTSYAHAVMHVENAVNNLRADLAVLECKFNEALRRQARLSEMLAVAHFSLKVGNQPSGDILQEWLRQIEDVLSDHG